MIKKAANPYSSLKYADLQKYSVTSKTSQSSNIYTPKGPNRLQIYVQFNKTLKEIE